MITVQPDIMKYLEQRIDDFKEDFHGYSGFDFYLHHSRIRASFNNPFYSEVSRYEYMNSLPRSDMVSLISLDKILSTTLKYPGPLIAVGTTTYPEKYWKQLLAIGTEAYKKEIIKPKNEIQLSDNEKKQLHTFEEFKQFIENKGEDIDLIDFSMYDGEEHFRLRVNAIKEGLRKQKANFKYFENQRIENGKRYWFGNLGNDKFETLRKKYFKGKQSGFEINYPDSRTIHLRLERQLDYEDTLSEDRTNRNQFSLLRGDTDWLDFRIMCGLMLKNMNVDEFNETYLKKHKPLFNQTVQKTFEEMRKTNLTLSLDEITEMVKYSHIVRKQIFK